VCFNDSRRFSDSIGRSADLANEAKQEVEIKKGTEVQRAAPRRMMSPFEEMDRLFERIFPRGWLRPMSWDPMLLGELAESVEMRAPRMDVYDGEENVVIRAEIPGVEKKNLEISVNDTSVTIKGKIVREQKEEKGEYYRCEIGSGELTRTVMLPCAVDGAKASAQLKDGMLEVTLPKVEKSKRHTVKID
jgi:HSP20 family protein